MILNDLFVNCPQHLNIIWLECYSKESKGVMHGCIRTCVSVKGWITSLLTQINHPLWTIIWWKPSLNSIDTLVMTVEICTQIWCCKSRPICKLMSQLLIPNKCHCANEKVRDNSLIGTIPKTITSIVSWVISKICFKLQYQFASAFSSAIHQVKK